MGRKTSNNIQLSGIQGTQSEITSLWAYAITEAAISPLHECIRKVSENARLSLINVLHEIHEQNKNSLRKIVQQITSSFNISLPKFDYYSERFTHAKYYEAEIVPQDIDELRAINQQVQRSRASLSLAILPGGSFRYRRRVLKGLGAGKSNPGRLLALFLEQETHFVTDDNVRTNLYLPTTRELSYVIRDLKSAFKKNRLSIEIERRWNPDGYQIIKIHEIQ